MADRSAIDDAAIRNDRMINLCAIDFRARQKAGTAENRRAHVEEIEARQFIRNIQVRFKKGADGSDIFPITLENKRAYAEVFNRLGDDMLPKVCQVIFQQSEN